MENRLRGNGKHNLLCYIENDVTSQTQTQKEIQMDNISISYTCWKCQYHIVFISKYPKKVLYGTLRDDVRKTISRVCKYKDVDIVAGVVCMYYVHLS